MAMMGAVAGLASREGVEVIGMEAAAVVLSRLRRGPGVALLIAIDGPGRRREVDRRARMLARELGFTYLDSGAMYRCVALLVAASSRAPTPRSSPARAGIELLGAGRRERRPGAARRT